MRINRQSVQNRVIHWGVAISIFGLILSGIFEMPIAKRYNVNKIPGFSWASDYILNLNLHLHYIFACALIFFSVFHVVYHVSMREFDIFPKRGDFKASFLVIKAMITGKDEPPSDKYLPEQRLAYLAIAGVILLLILHLLAFVPKANRNLLSAMFSGKIDAKYAAHRHSEWIKKDDKLKFELSKLKEENE